MEKEEEKKNIINNSKALINNDDVNVGIKPDVKNNKVVVSLCSCSIFCIFNNNDDENE